MGIIFDSRLTWEINLGASVQENDNKSLPEIEPSSSLSQKPNPNSMIHLYRSIIRPIFEYGSVCIINAAEHHLGKIQLVQNQALRIVMKSPRYTSIHDLHDCTGTPLIKNYLISDAKHRLQIMRKNSPIIGKVIVEYQALQHIQENASPLDILANQRDQR